MTREKWENSVKSLASMMLSITNDSEKSLLMTESLIIEVNEKDLF